MVNVGDAIFTVELALDQLRADAAKAAEELKRTLKDPVLKPSLSTGSEITQLARSLGTNFKAAQDFSEALQINAAQAAQLIGQLRSLEQVGATLDEQFAALNAEFGVTKDQFAALAAASKSAQSGLQNTSGDITQLALATGGKFQGAKDFSNSLGLNAGQAAKLIEQIKRLNSVGANAEDMFSALNEESNVTREQFERLSEAALKGEKGLLGVYKRFKEGVAESSLYTQALGEISFQLKNIGASTTAYANQAQAAFVAFDDARAKVATLTNESEKFASASRELAKELGYQQSSTELLAASYDVLSSGFSEVADVNKILEASSRGAQGGFSDIGTVSDATTTILNAYKLSAEDAARVVDILAVTQDKGKITIDQYASSVGRAASIAALSGVSFEEFSAAVATATAKGVPAESAVSGVRQAIVNLLKPTADAQAVLEKYGISSGAAALQAGGLIGVLQQLGDIPTDELSKVFSDVDALTSITPLAGSNLADLQANFDAVNNSAGKAALSAEKVANSFRGKTTAALNEANEALVTIGEGVAVAVNPLLDALTKVLGLFNALPAPAKQFTGALVAVSGGALTAAGSLAGLAALFPALKLGSISAAAGIKALGIAIKTAIPALLALSLAVEAASLLKYAGDVQQANRQIGAFIGTVSAQADEAFAAANKTKSVVEQLNAARKKGQAVSEEDKRKAQGLLQLNKQRIESIKEQIKQVNEEIQTTDGLTDADDAQRKAKEQLVKQLEISLKALNGQNKALEESLAPAKRSIQQTAEQVSAYEKLTAALEANQAANEKDFTRAKTDIANRSTGSNQEDIDKQSLAAEKDFLNQRIKLNEDALIRLREIRSSSKDKEEVEKAAKDILKIEQEIDNDRLSLAEAGAKAREDATKAAEERQRKIKEDARKAEEQALKKLDDANKRAEAAIEKSQSDRVTAVKKAQLDGEISEREAAEKIAQIQQDSTVKAIELKQKELEQVRVLREQGTIGAEEAATREANLQKEISGLNIQAIDQELAIRRQNAEEQAQLESNRLAVVQQTAEAELAIRANALQAENDLINASLGVLQARFDLETEITSNKIKQAKEQGQIYEVDRLLTEQKKRQRDFEDAQYRAKIQQLKITAQLQQIELARDEVSSRIAIKEAEINLRKAEQAGATQDELDLLQQILNLQRGKLDQIDQTRATQEKLNAAQLNELQTQRLITEERRRQQDLDEQKARLNNGGLLPDSTSGVGDGSTSGGVGSGKRQSFILTGDQIGQFRQASSGDRSLSGQLSSLQLGGGNQFASFLASPIANQLAKFASGGFAQNLQAQNLASQFDKGILTADDVGRKLDELINVTRGGLSRPNLTVSSASDLSLAGRIYNDISRDRMRSNGL